jgi:hypothetical protein
MFVLSSDLPDTQSNIYFKRWREQWKSYGHYLDRIKNKLRPHTRDFALAEWHYDHNDPRCPHDAWLESVLVREIPSPDNIASRVTEIVARLLGAYHDGYIELTYHDVLSFTFDLPYRRHEHGQHGDWLVDEVRFSEHGRIIHEIEWADGGHWIIECNDIEYKWLPMNQPQNDG